MGKSRVIIIKNKQLGEFGGYWVDIVHAEDLLRKNFPLEEVEEELANAKIRVLQILDNPICWSMVENLAKKLIDAV